jgi:ferrochelatase
MRISSIVDIVGGKLINKPSISFITQINILARKVNDGDLFIANNTNDIQLAINNGAFAILYQGYTDVLDDEIAWIKVRNINNAMVKILRFILSNKNITSYYCDDVSYELFNIYKNYKKNLIILSNNIETDFDNLKIIPNSNTILISNCRKYIKLLQPNLSKFTVVKHKIKNHIKHSLFTTTFSYNNKLYYKISLPSVYTNHFLSVLDFFDSVLDINKLKQLNYFSPIFINKELSIIDFGKSNRFIIANNSKKLISNELKFLKSMYSYATIVIIDYLNDEKLLIDIKAYKYNALYIRGRTYEDIVILLNSNKVNTQSLI